MTGALRVVVRGGLWRAAVGAGVLVLALTGCGGQSDAKNQSLSTISERGTLNVGSCLATPPWGIINSAGNPDGFDVDVAKQLGEFLGVKVNDTDVSAASRVPSLQSGKLDVVSCTFTVTPERQEQVDFSLPVVNTGNSLVTRKGSSIKTVDDLTGHTVAVNKGGSAIGVTQAANAKAKLQPYESFADALLAVKQGQADAMIDTSDAMASAVKKDPSLVLAVDGKVGPIKHFALGVRKDEPDLLAKVNEFVTKFHAEGTGIELYRKWFESDPTYQFEGLEG
jgi:polar amino acid transport system substrate-binding protein